MDSRHPIVSRRARWLPLLIVVLGFSALLLSTASDLRVFEQKSPFVVTQGNVTRLDCWNHAYYEVTYVSDEQRITSSPGNLFLRGACDDLHIGDSVDVWYSSRDHSYAAFVPPHEALSRMKTELFSIVVVGSTTLLVCAALITLFGFWKDRPKREV
jgi:hypothetical protein